MTDPLEVGLRDKIAEQRRQIERLETEIKLVRRRLADSVNARAVVEGTLIVGIERLPKIVRQHMQEVIANALANAKEVDSGTDG